MSSYYFIFFFLLTNFLSYSALFLPINSLDDNDRYSPLMNQNDEYIRNLSPNDNRYQRALEFYPRTSRNTWFRVSTYQHFKPSVLEETPSGDNLLRWGR